MRIVVNDIAASKTGALSVLQDFYNYIAKHDKKNEWIFLVGDNYIAETENIKVHVLSKVKRNWLSRLKFDLLTGSSYIRGLKPDVVFSMQNTVTFGYRGKQIVYLHQPLGFQSIKKFSLFKKREREYAIYQYIIGALIDASVKKADCIIVQTKWMRAAVAEKTRISAEKIYNVLPNVADIRNYKKSGILKTNHFFFPSGDIIYKNHDCIIKACQILNQRGITDFEVAFTLDGLSGVSEMKFKDTHHNIVCVGKMPREAVFDFYNRRVLIFPSYIETFGFPIAEAMQLGSLILASDCSFCHEILDGYKNAYFFDPFDAEELANYMEQVIKGTITLKKTDFESTENCDKWAEVAEIILKR